MHFYMLSVLKIELNSYTYLILDHQCVIVI
nr:MAG TPA: hypothetical protein [Bacteriophage sp.]